MRPASDRARSDVVLPAELLRLADWVNGRRWKVMGVFLVTVAIFSTSLPWLKFESDFVKNFRPESEVRQSYEFIESNLSPTGSAEMVVRRKDGGSVLSAHAVGALRIAGERAVEQFDVVRKALTLADVLTLGPGGVPSTTIELKARLSLVRNLLGEDVIRNFLNEDETAMRMNLRVVEGYPVAEKLKMGEQLRAMTADALGEEYEVEATGLYIFYAKLVAGLWEDQFRSLYLTIPAVFLVLLIVLRSFKVALVALIPTILPILFCLGAMGWVGIPVNMTTAMMLSVTVGIAVDDALHYLWRFKSAYREGGNYLVALRTAHSSVGRACVFTTIVIAGGFWILMLSEFLPTAYFGGLLGFTMCCALATDLLLLPAMVMTFRPFGPERSA